MKLEAFASPREAVLAINRTIRNSRWPIRQQRFSSLQGSSLKNDFQAGILTSKGFNIRLTRSMPTSGDTPILTMRRPGCVNSRAFASSAA